MILDSLTDILGSINTIASPSYEGYCNSPLLKTTSDVHRHVMFILGFSDHIIMHVLRPTTSSSGERWILPIFTCVSIFNDGADKSKNRYFWCRLGLESQTTDTAATSSVHHGKAC